MQLALATTLASILGAATGCAGLADPGGYDQDWGDAVGDGKADGELDGAVRIDFETPGSGQLGGDEVDAYYLDLEAGDSIRLQQTRTGGDLGLHFTLYLEGTTYVPSTSYELAPHYLRKVYAPIATTGRYLIAARPYQGNGAGSYLLTATCFDGGCLELDPDRPLDFWERGSCIGEALACSLDALPRYGGLVGPVRSREIFTTCLEAGLTFEGRSCAPACEDDADAATVCTSVIEALPFYADHLGPCLEEVDECLAACSSVGGDTYGETVFDTGDALCWSTGVTSTCDAYARGHQACGGDYDDGSPEQCLAWCESTAGAYGEVDDICPEECAGE